MCAAAKRDRNLKNPCRVSMQTKDPQRGREVFLRNVRSDAGSAQLIPAATADTLQLFLHNTRPAELTGFRRPAGSKKRTHSSVRRQSDNELILSLFSGRVGLLLGYHRTGQYCYRRKCCRNKSEDPVVEMRVLELQHDRFPLVYRQKMRSFTSSEFRRFVWCLSFLFFSLPHSLSCINH